MSHQQKWNIAILAACAVCLWLFAYALWLEPNLTIPEATRASQDQAVGYFLGNYFVVPALVSFLPLLGTWLWQYAERKGRKILYWPLSFCVWTFWLVTLLALLAHWRTG